MTPEFSRPIDIRQADGRTIRLEANADERQALAARFGLVAVIRLEAELVLARDGETVMATGMLNADIVQSCAISAEDLPVAIAEPVALRFVPESTASSDEEVELAADDLDEIGYAGTTLELGEAIAQGLAVAIDPFATGPQADAARSLLGDEAESPFAVLKGLKRD